MFGKTKKNKNMQNAFLWRTDSAELIYWCYNLSHAFCYN